MAKVALSFGCAKQSKNLEKYLSHKYRSQEIYLLFLDSLSYHFNFIPWKEIEQHYFSNPVFEGTTGIPILVNQVILFNMANNLLTIYRLIFSESSIYLPFIKKFERNFCMRVLLCRFLPVLKAFMGRWRKHQH